MSTVFSITIVLFEKNGEKKNVRLLAMLSDFCASFLYETFEMRKYLNTNQ